MTVFCRCLIACFALLLLAGCASSASERHISANYMEPSKRPSAFVQFFSGHDNNAVPIEELIRYILLKTGAQPLCDMEPGPVHAEKGFSVMLAGRQVAFYKYNTKYKKMRNKLEYVNKNKCLYIVGRKYTAVANGSFVMIDYDTNPRKDQLLKVFMEF
ncbi:MAG: hypothetical protein IKB16_03590 [Lentisphaeria bacterium]|nr:hypothetical protein [Lentisphaeria bacterium]